MFIVDSAVRQGCLRGVCLAVLGRWGWPQGLGRELSVSSSPQALLWLFRRTQIKHPVKDSCPVPRFLSFLQSLGQISLLSEARNLYSHLQKTCVHLGWNNSDMLEGFAVQNHGLRYLFL